MMKLIGSMISRRSVAISRVLSGSFFSTETRSASSLRGETLYQKIWRSGDPSISMVSLLDQWLKEGRKVKQSELQRLIKQLRKHRRYSQALQISEWMSDVSKCTLSSGDMAVRLDLISKVRGLNQAEAFFNSIPSSSRIDKIHGALLNSYAEKNSLDKAEHLFNQMKEFGFLNLVLTYNVMLSLYSRMGKYEKLNVLLREMEDYEIKCDNFTYAIRLNALAITSDVEGFEKLLMSMEADPQVSVDVHAYFIAAKGYLKANLLEKAFIVLRKAEDLIETSGKRFYFEHLFTLHAASGNKEELLRVWKKYKGNGRATNTGYLALLSSLVKLEDFDGLEIVFEEWESQRTCFDNRIANLLISAYCKKGLFEKAFSYLDRLVNSGYEPEASLWQCLANHCCMDGQMAKAVDSLRKAALACGRSCNLNFPTLASCVEFLKRERDQETALEILGLFRHRGSLSNGVYNRLVEFLKSDDDCGALDAMKEDGDFLALDGKLNGW